MHVTAPAQPSQLSVIRTELARLGPSLGKLPGTRKGATPKARARRGHYGLLSMKNY